jgi:DNA-nicking Smr family endonuclease
MSGDQETENSQTESSFRKLMKGVTPLKQERADLSPPIKRADDYHYRRAAAVEELETITDGLTDEIMDLVDSNEALFYSVPGVQQKLFKKLRQGHIPWGEGLDLHGYKVDDARDLLTRFIRNASRKRQRCVILVHGKAISAEGKPPLLKSYANIWLRQLPEVLAFCSAQPKDGGTGALYVLLKKTNTGRTAEKNG